MGEEEAADLVVEATGETVGEAKWQALRRLDALASGVDRATVRFEVLSEGERGLLGVGYSPARVIARASAPARREPDASSADREPPSTAGELAAAVVERIVSALRLDARVSASEDDERITVTCTGPDLGLLIGRHGQTIDAVQYLVNAVVRARTADERDAVVDASGYRARREATLRTLAEETAGRVVETGRPAELEPMSAVERKIVHLHLRDHPAVETSSAGAEPNRYVVVSPRGG